MINIPILGYKDIDILTLIYYNVYIKITQGIDQEQKE